MKVHCQTPFGQSLCLIPLITIVILIIIVILFCPTPASRGMGLDFGGGTPELVIPPGPMKAPMRLTATKDGRFLISDYQARKIMLYDPRQPEPLSEAFPVAGTPLAIEIMHKFVLVGNDQAGTIEVYKDDGKMLRLFISEGPIQASDMAYDPQARLVFVADALNREIKVFRENGELLRSFGMLGPLVRPTGIAIDPQEKKVFVSDYGDSKAADPTARLASLQIYDYEGALLKKITGSFSRPQGIAADATRIFMADAIRGQILIFERTGDYALVNALGKYGVAEGELFLPMDVYYDAANARLLVTDSRLGKITIFSLAEP